MVSSPNPGGVYAVAIVLGVISIIAILLRFLARRSLAKHTKLPAWKSDDWLVCVSVLFTWGLAIILIYGAAAGTLGTHTSLNPQTGAVIVTPHENQTSLFGAIAQILQALALGILKSGVVLFYRRIFQSKVFRAASLFVLVFLAAWMLAFVLATVLECKGQNLDLVWKSIQTFKKQCYEYKNIELAFCVTDVATDLMVLCLPLREIWTLSMRIREKILVSLIFLVGLLSLAAGSARLAIVVENIVETTPGARDVRGVGTNVLVWSYVEVGVGVVAACLPTFGPLINRHNLGNIIAGFRAQTSGRATGEALDEDDNESKSQAPRPGHDPLTGSERV